jgi:hypothetical protein
MALHNTDTIYRKLRMNATVLPPEILLLIRNLDERVTVLEEMLNEKETRTEKPKPHRRKSGKISEGEVSPTSLPTGSE